MNDPGALSTSVIVSYSALTTGWIGVLGYIAFRKEKAEDESVAGDTLETARARRLVTERYGASFGRQDATTKQWWIVTESGNILGSGDTEGEAWIHSAFMDVDEPRYLISVEP